MTRPLVRSLIVLAFAGCAVGTEPIGGGAATSETADASDQGEAAGSIVADDSQSAGDDAGASDASKASDAKASPADAAASSNDAAAASSACPGYALPDETAPCKACQQSSSTCQPNGCYGGYYCDLSGPKCRPKPSGC